MSEAFGAYPYRTGNGTGSRKISRASVLPDAVIADLKERFALKSRVHDFKPGDIVRQVECLNAYKVCGEPVVVVCIDEEGVMARLGNRSPLDDGEPINFNTMIIGHIDGDGDYVEHAVDRSRFEPWPVDGAGE